MVNDLMQPMLTWSSVNDNPKVKNVHGVLDTNEEKAIAAILNSAINIPFIGEKREGELFLKGIRLVDAALSRLLPKDLLDAIHYAKDGIRQEETEGLEKRLTPIINRNINIPLIPEFVEERLIRMVLGIILNALSSGQKIPGSTKITDNPA